MIKSIFFLLLIGHNPVKKLDFLYDLPELRVLIVAICDVTDITPIASLKHLEYLEIFHNRITDISCLTGLEYLMDLNLVKNKVKDLTPLTKMKSLKRLWIHLADVDDPGIPDEATLRALQEALPDCHIDAEPKSLVSSRIPICLSSILILKTEAKSLTKSLKSILPGAVK